jgi:hypothetical protein
MTPTLQDLQQRHSELQQRHEELGQLLAQYAAGARETRMLVLPETDIELQPGEHYAGAVLDEEGHVQHHLVLMAARPGKPLAWQAAMDWIEGVAGGVAPSRQELALLFANCRPHLEPTWHWSGETHEDDASYAWYCYFGYGYQYDRHKSAEGSCVAVRRA